MGGTPLRGGVAAALVIASAGLSCKEIEPETGSIRPRCTDEDSNPAVPVDFARDIRPLINDQVPGTRGCLFCHSPATGTMEGFLQTGLDLTTLQAIRKGATGAPNVVVPGKPCESILVQKLQGTFPEGARMPKQGPYWDDAKIRLMIDWIAEGAQGADE